MARGTDLKKLAAVKRRITELRDRYPEDVKTNQFIRLPIGTMVTEAEWLVQEVERLTAEESPVETDESNKPVGAK